MAKWRHRFAADRLEGLTDAPRPGAARTIGDEVIEAVVVETLETTPADASHWSTRAMAERHGIGRQLTTKKLQRSAHRSVKALAADIRNWVETWNQNPRPFTWHKSAEEILDRLVGYCRAINK